MSIQKILFITFLFFFSGFMTPAEAAIATRGTVKNTNTSIALQKGKKLSFKDKIKLIRKVRAEARAAKKVSPQGTNSIMRNQLFVFGLILLVIGAVVGALGIPVVSVLGGLVSLAGFIMMIIGLVQYFS